MIIEFSVENFRSIKDRQTFSMVGAGLRNEDSSKTFTHNALKGEEIQYSSVIYGANASGKSNFIDAIRAFQFIVATSANYKKDAVIPPYEPYLLDVESKSKPIFFELEFIAFNDLRYVYSFSFLDNRIVSEKLEYYTTKKALLFERFEDGSYEFGSHIKGQKKAVADSTAVNSLYLSKGANSNIDALSVPFQYISQFISVYGNSESDFIMPSQQTVEMLVNNQTVFDKDLVLSFLQSADSTISDISIEQPDNLVINFPGIEEVPSEIKDFFENEAKYIPLAHHKVYDGDKVVGEVKFSLKNEESVGTRKLFRIASLIMMRLAFGGVLIVDELDNSLHSHITSYVISLFSDCIRSKYSAQLIFATHDINILTPSNFRRDQVWFTQKDTKGSTTIYSLAEFDTSRVRKETNYGAWYSQGRLGGVPVIKNEFSSKIQKVIDEFENA